LGSVLRGDVNGSERAAFLDPLFWQCLGKALGWKVGNDVDYLYNAKEPIRIEHGVMDEWLYLWHRFIDHLAEGKSVEEFLTT